MATHKIERLSLNYVYWLVLVLLLLVLVVRMMRSPYVAINSTAYYSY